MNKVKGIRIALVCVIASALVGCQKEPDRVEYRHILKADLKNINFDVLEKELALCRDARSKSPSADFTDKHCKAVAAANSCSLNDVCP